MKPIKVVAVIPARYGSSRLPGKPLADLLGKPMIQHVHERVQKVPGIDEIVVATDDPRIVSAVQAFGGQALLTDPNHPSGTDRLVEVMTQVPADLYLNVHGDEPLVDPDHLQKLIETMLSDDAADVGTLCHPISDREAENPNAVKCVLDHQGMALYFSRSRIPFSLGSSQRSYQRNIAVFAYRSQALAWYATLPSSPLEQTEIFEHLRLLQAGARFRVVEVPNVAPELDTPNSLQLLSDTKAGQSAKLKTPDFTDIRLVITDVDGVLTDGGIFYDATGECLKRFHVRDGLGIKMLQACGIEVAVVSGRDSATLRKRVSDLGISLFDFAVKDKAATCLRLMSKLSVTRAQTLVVGDDTIDLPAFAVCGTSVAVADAPSYVRRAATMTLTTVGGHGAFRELCDLLLQAQGHTDVYQTAEGYERVMERMAQ